MTNTPESTADDIRYWKSRATSYQARLLILEKENTRLREALSVMRRYPGIKKYCGSEICDFVDDALGEGKIDDG